VGQLSAAPRLPAKYQAASRALAECVRIDDLKNYRDKAMAMEVYAMQRKDPELIGKAIYMRRRAVFRIGELMEDDRSAGKLAKGAAATGGPGRGKKGKNAGLRIPRVFEAPTLAARGVDKNQAMRATPLSIGKFLCVDFYLGAKRGSPADSAKVYAQPR
jgi:hypothetical protein